MTGQIPNIALLLATINIAISQPGMDVVRLYILMT